MEVYLFSLYFIFVFLFLSNLKTEKINKIFLITMSFLIMVTVSGIRYNVGTDFSMYEVFFFRIKRMSLFRRDLEFLFILFAKIAYFFSNNSATMFTLIASYIYFFLYNISIKRVKYYELAIFLFITFGFYTSSLNILRQWMAIPLIIKAFDMFADNKNYKGIICIILAMLSHYTVIYTIPVLLAIYLIKSDKIRIVLIITAIIMYLSTDFITNLIVQILEILGFGEIYIKYLSFNKISTSVFVMPMFTLVTYIGYYMFLKKDKFSNISDKRFTTYLVNFVVVGFMTSLLGCKLMFFERIQFYFVVAIIFLIPQIIAKVHPNTRKVIYAFCLIMGTVFYIYSLNNNGGDPLPFQTIFYDKWKI